MPEKPGYDGSTALKSVMQEMFTTNILSGMFQSEAYQKAGYKANTAANSLEANASRLISNDNVKIRLAYKRALLAKKADITVESLLLEFEKNKDLARECKQVGAANQALSEQGRLLGLYEADNSQKQGKSVVEILAIVANSKHQRAIAGSQTPSKGQTPAEGTIEPPIEAIIEQEDHETV